MVNGQYVPFTRGYLIFQDKDKLAVLSNQIVIVPGQRHEPEKHVERLKRDILEFRKTFEFGLTPISVDIVERSLTSYIKTFFISICYHLSQNGLALI